MPVDRGPKLSMEESLLRDERRAKMAALARDLDPTASRDTCTSAPSVRKVGEFHTNYGVADQKVSTPRAPVHQNNHHHGGRVERIGQRIHHVSYN